MAHTEFGLHERRAIDDMLNAKLSVDKIAAEIGRHRSTVFREIKRNRFVDCERPLPQVLPRWNDNGASFNPSELGSCVKEGYDSGDVTVREGDGWVIVGTAIVFDWAGSIITAKSSEPHFGRMSWLRP